MIGVEVVMSNHFDGETLEEQIKCIGSPYKINAIADAIRQAGVCRQGSLFDDHADGN